MEDKELKELFAAKRTAEANRRRQEELRRMLQAESGKKKVGSHRLWPVWIDLAAATLALLLLTLPSLFRSESSAPVLLAEATPSPTPKKNRHPHHNNKS